MKKVRKAIIPAAGLLVFGVGGMAFVYVIAPLIDNWVKEHLNKRLSTACLVLLLLFGADVVYSHFGSHSESF